MKNLPLVLTAVLFFLPFTSSIASGEPKTRENWPSWRGPDNTGASANATPPVRWSESQNVRYKVDLPGKGHSTPIVWEDRIFLTTAVKTDKPVDPKTVAAAEQGLPEWRQKSGVPPAWVVQFQVIALDRRDGSILWQKTLLEKAPHEGLHIDSSWASNSPVTDGEVLVAHFGSNGTYCLDLDGNLLWTVDLGDMRTRRGFGEGSSPALAGDHVVINWDHEDDSFLTVLDRKTGKTRWKKERDEITSWSTPLILNVRNKQQIIINATNKTRGYDLESGGVIWEAAGMTVNTIPSPVADATHVFVTSGYRGSKLLSINLAAAIGDITNKEAINWEHDRDTPYVPSPLLLDDNLYFLKQNKAILTCLDKKTGKVHFERQRIGGIRSIYASLAGADNKIYAVGREGLTVVFRHGSRFEILSENRLDDSFDASPVFIGADLYLRGHHRLYCLSASTKKATGQ